jgi:hypothetical protein
VGTFTSGEFAVTQVICVIGHHCGCDENDSSTLLDSNS